MRDSSTIPQDDLLRIREPSLLLRPPDHRNSLKLALWVAYSRVSKADEEEGNDLQNHTSFIPDDGSAAPCEKDEGHERATLLGDPFHAGRMALKKRRHRVNFRMFPHPLKTIANAVVQAVLPCDREGFVSRESQIPLEPARLMAVGSPFKTFE